MKKALFILLCFYSVCNAQNKQIDSLMNVLKTAKEDTNKTITLNALSDKLRITGNYEKAKMYANDALQLSEKINYKIGKCNAYNRIGTIESLQGNYSTALRSHLNDLKISEEIGYKKGIANSKFGIAAVHGHH